jgi:signal transduction histidine kinase
MNEAREAIWSLRHEPDRMQDLTSLMLRMGTQLSSDLGIAIDCKVEGEPFPVSRGFAHELLMVVREAVHNAANHADPTRIELKLGYAQEYLDVDVVDDGCGFTQDETSDEQDKHFGLIGMRERVVRLGGTFRLDSGPAAGTVIQIHLPLRNSALRDAMAGV